MHMRDGQVPPRARQRGRQAGPSLFEWAPPSGVGAAARPRGAGGPILSTGFFRTVSRAADGLTVLADDVPVGILQLAEDAGGQDAREGDLDTVGGHRAGAYIPPGKAVTIFLIRLFIGHPTHSSCPGGCPSGCPRGCPPRAVRVCVVAGSLARAAQCGCHGSGHCANSLDSLTARPACLPEARAVAPRSRRCHGRDCRAEWVPWAITEHQMHDLKENRPRKWSGGGRCGEPGRPFRRPGRLTGVRSPGLFRFGPRHRFRGPEGRRRAVL
jgi:hypothetical protein